MKIVSGAVNATKWSAKGRNWNISDIFFTLSSIEGRKQLRRPEIFAVCMGTKSSEKAGQEMVFSFDIRDTPRSGRPSGFMKIV